MTAENPKKLNVYRKIALVSLIWMLLFIPSLIVLRLREGFTIQESIVYSILMFIAPGFLAYLVFRWKGAKKDEAMEKMVYIRTFGWCQVEDLDYSLEDKEGVIKATWRDVKGRRNINFVRRGDIK